MCTGVRAPWKFNPRGAAYSVWWLFDPAGRFRARYVNLESRRPRGDDGEVAGSDLTDQDLDIWVWPDRRWACKDEDEFTERLAFPDHYWVDDAEAVEQARRVVRRSRRARSRSTAPGATSGPGPLEYPAARRRGWDRPRDALRVQFTPGRLVVHPTCARCRFGWVRPASVVSDDEPSLPLWVARRLAVRQRGLRRRVRHAGDAVRRVGDPRYLAQAGTWNGPGVLKAAPRPPTRRTRLAGSATTGTVPGWYVNLDSPPSAEHEARTPASTSPTGTSTSSSPRPHLAVEGRGGVPRAPRLPGALLWR